MMLYNDVCFVDSGLWKIKVTLTKVTFNVKGYVSIPALPCFTTNEESEIQDLQKKIIVT